MRPMRISLPMRISKSKKRLLSIALAILVLFTNIPVGFIELVIQKYEDRNVIDALWLSQQDISVIDSFQVQTADAAESLVDNSILDATDEFGPSPSTVFTDDQEGYVFYVDGSTQDLVYRKTTNGGVNWTTLGTVNSATTGWTAVSVWYDQWTPGDTSGTKIHIAASDDASDDVFYTFLDTNGDSLKGSMVTALSGTTTITESTDGPPSITKGAGGALFIASNFTNTAGGKVAKSTDGAGDTWTENTPASWSSVAIDQIQLLPLSTDQDIIAIKAQTGDNTLRYRIYDEVGDAWDGAWSSSITSLTENTTYDNWYSATVEKSTGDIYLSVVNQINNAANDMEFWSFDDSSRGSGFVQGGNLFTNDQTVLSPSPIVDQVTGDIYVTYLRGTLNNTMSAYFKKSTDGGSTWSNESVQLNALQDDLKTVKGNMMSDSRLTATYYCDDRNDIFLSTITDLIEVTIDDTILDATDEYGTSPAVVFTTDQLGYVFYIDATSQDLAYKKTSNGGKNWDDAATVIDTTISGWTAVAVWYDQWTPGDTSGTKIHIAASDDAADDIYYTYLDTNGNTLKGSVVAAVSGTAALNESTDGPPSITKGAGGDLFISGNFTTTAGGKVSKSSDGSGNSWSDVTPSGWSTVAIDQIQLLPLSTGSDIIALKAQTADNTIRYQIYNETSNTWGGTWNSIGTLTENTTYDQWFSATIKKSTGDVYLTFANQTNNAANDIQFWVFDESNRGSGFTQGTDVITNDATVIDPVPLMDETTGDVYVAYLKGTLGGAMQVYYRSSTDGGSTWGSESASLAYGMADDNKYLRGNLLDSERLYVVWYNDDLNDLMGNTLVDLTPETSYEQSGYRFFNNNDSTDVGSPIASQDTPVTAPAQGTGFRLRLLMHVSGLDLDIGGEDFKLQIAERSGTCDPEFTGETYADLSSSSGDIRYYNNTTPADGVALTSNANDPTHSGDTVNDQTYEESNNFTNSESAIEVGEDGLWDFAIVDFSAAENTTYCVRVVKSDGSVLDTYTVMPEFTTVPENTFLLIGLFPVVLGFIKKVKKKKNEYETKANL